MNFKRLGDFGIVIGLISLGLGLILYASNQPVQLSSGTYFQAGVEAGTGRAGAATEAIRRKEARDRNRDMAQKVLFGGVIVLVLGIGIRISAK